MSGFSPLRDGHGSGTRGGSDPYDADSDCEVDGSFIILANHHHSSVASSPQNCADSPLPEMNVFQLGQQQLSMHNQYHTPEPEPETSVHSTDMNSTLTESVTENVTNTSSTTVPETVNSEETLISVISNMSSCSSDSTASFEEANSKVLQLLEENMSLKVFVRELNEKQRKFLENCKVLESAVAKSKDEAQEQERKYDRSRSVIETLRAKVADLELKATTGSPRNSLNASDSNTEIRRLERQLVEKESLLQDATTQNADLKELLRKLGTELNEAKMSAISLIDVTSLQGERDFLSNAFEEAKVTISKLTERHEVDQEELKKGNEAMEALRAEAAEVNALLQVQIEVNRDLESSCRQKTEEIKFMTVQWQVSLNDAQVLEEKMDSRDLDIQVLKDALEKLESDTRSKIALLESEVNEKDIFQAQMREFKSNFEEEQMDRLALKAEKVRLADELTRLQMMMEAKDEELQNLHRLQLASEHMDRGQGGPSNKNTSTSDEGAGGNASGFTASGSLSAPPVSNDPPSEVSYFTCPLCPKTFRSQTALITHASSCGDVFEDAHSPSGFVFP